MNIDVRALAKETKTLGSRAGADKVTQSTSKDTFVDIGGIASIDGFVAAGKLRLVATLCLGLLHSHVFRNREANIGVALVRNTIGIAFTSSTGWQSRNSHCKDKKRDGGKAHTGCLWVWLVTD